MLGGLWNGEDTPPESNADGKNDRRSITSRSGHVIRLTDTDGEEQIEIIDSSANNSIVISTKDNSIKVSADGDITIKAGGKLTLQADGQLIIKGRPSTSTSDPGGEHVGQPAAKQGDQITATDTHIVIVPDGSGPSRLPHTFDGLLSGELSTDVNIMGKPAAVVGSTASNISDARADAARHVVPDSAEQQGDHPDRQHDGQDQRQARGA